MLDLYHSEPHGESARMLICLEEKELEFTSHFLDPLALEHYQLPLGRIRPAGEIPVLVRAGEAYAGASATCELLEEAYPGRPLMPREPRARWAVRVWQKYVDDGFGPSVGELAWHAYGARSLPPAGPGALAEAVERLVPREERPSWREALAGYGEERLARARARVAEAVARVEAALAGSAWLAGSAYTLADVAVFAYFKYLPALCPDYVNSSVAHRALRWLDAVSGRAAVRAALARGRASDPYTVAIPAPEQIRWG